MTKLTVGLLVLSIVALFGVTGCFSVVPEHAPPPPSYNYPPQPRYGQEDLSRNQGIGGFPPGATQYPGDDRIPADPGAAGDSGLSGGGPGVNVPGSADDFNRQQQIGAGTTGGTEPGPSGQGVREPAQPSPGGDHPRGIPVPNMPGHVYSPYSRDQGIVDVSEWPSGTLVKDPFKPDQELWFFVP